MPIRIQHIDQIAREKKRDVLFLGFPMTIGRLSKPQRDCTTRDELMKWLEVESIAFAPCGLVASEYAMPSYAGHLYIDLPHDEEDPLHQKLLGHLEHPDGSPKIPETQIYLYTHQKALKNAHHDEPGFWENWAEKI